MASTGKFFTSTVSFDPHKSLWRQVVLSGPSYRCRHPLSGGYGWALRAPKPTGEDLCHKSDTTQGEQLCWQIRRNKESHISFLQNASVGEGSSRLLAGSSCALPQPTGWPGGKSRPPREGRLGPRLTREGPAVRAPLVPRVETKLILRSIVGLWI